MNREELQKKKNEFKKKNKSNIDKFIKEKNEQFEAMKIKFKDYKFNYIYFLQVSTEYYKNEHLVNHRFESYVYSTIEKAIIEGKKFLDLYFNEILEDNNLKSNYEELTKLEIIKEEIKNKNLHYSFSIEKFDPYYKDNFVKPEGSESMVIGIEPATTQYFYDFKGKEIYKEIKYGESKYGWAFVNDIFPGDENKNAGTKFNIGDLVYDMNWQPNSMHEGEEDRPIIMIRNRPNRSEKSLFTNTYSGIGIDKDGNLLPFYDHMQESQLKLYKRAKDIPNNSVWIFVKNLIDHYDEIKPKVFERIMNGEINFLETKSYRDINVKDCFKTIEKNNVLSLYTTKNPNLQIIYNIWNKAHIIGSISFSEGNNNTAIIEFYKNYEEMDQTDNFLRRLLVRDKGYSEEFEGKAYEVIIENNLNNLEQIFKSGKWYTPDFQKKSTKLVERSTLCDFFEKQYEEIEPYMNYDEVNNNE